MANLDIIIRAQNLAANVLRQVDGQLAGLQRQAGFAERGFSGLQNAVGVGMAAAAGLAVAGVGALAVGLARSVTAAADFESQINVLTVAARSSGTSMADLSAAALQVGSDASLVGISASEAADAMTNFYKAGLDTGEIMGDLDGYLSGNTKLTGALRSAIDLAAASELDLAQASDVVAVSMATFGLEAKDAARIADVLVGAADASLASVGGLADALINVGPAAAGMGIPLEDAATALALLSTRGISGAEAGTSLKSMLLNLQRPTKEVTATLNALGVSLYDAEGNFRPLPDVIGSLERAMGGLTEEQRQQAAVTLAGSYGLGAFNVLVGEGTKGWTAMAGAVDSAATAQEVAQARTKGFKAAMEQLKGALESFMIVVGTPLIQKILTPMAQWFGEIIGKVTELAGNIGSMDRLFVVFEDGSSFLSEFLGILGMSEKSAQKLATSIIRVIRVARNLFWEIMGLVGTIVRAIGQFVKWQDVLGALGIVVASMVIPALISIVTAAAPVIAVAAALVAAVALLRTAWENDWGGIQGNMNAAWDVIRTKFTDMQTWLETTIPAAIETLNTVWTAIWDGISTGDWTDLKDAWARLRAQLIALGQNFTEWITTQSATIAEKAKGWAVAFTDWVKAAWTNLKIKLAEMIALLSGWIAEQKPLIVEKVKGWIEAFTEWVKDIWTNLKTKLNETIASLSGWITEQKPILIEKVKGWSEAFTDWVKDVWANLKTKLAEMIASLSGWITEQKPIIAEQVKDWAVALVDWVKDIWVNLQPKLKTLGDDIVAWAGKVGEEIGTETQTWQEKLLSWMPQKETINKALMPMGDDMANSILDMQSTVSEAFGYMLGAALGGAIRLIGDAVVFFVGGIVGAIAMAFREPGTEEEISSGFGGLITRLFENIGKSFGATGKGFSDQIKGMIGDWELLFQSFDPSFTMAEMWKNVTSTWTTSTDALKTKLVETVVSIQTTWTTFWDALKTKLSETTATIQTTWTTFWDALKTKLSETTATIQTTWTTFWDALKMKLDEMTTSISSGWKTFWDGIKKKLDETMTALKKAVDDAWGAILGVFTTMQTWLTTTLQAAMNTFETFLSTFVLTNPFAAISDTITGIKSAIDRAKQAIEDFKNWLGTLHITNPLAGITFPNRPSWLGGNAAGSGFFPGGLTMVGERGREIVALPRGSRIESSERTERMMGGGVTVNLYATVSNPMDWEEAAYRVAEVIQRRQR